MRLLFTCILICLSFSATANVTKQEPLIKSGIDLPYILTGPRITQPDHLFCARRAGVGAAAHEFALMGGQIESQLKAWDEFTMSIRGDNINTTELTILRQIISYAWEAIEEFPNVGSREYGDFIYAACVKEKSLLQASNS